MHERKSREGRDMKKALALLLLTAGLVAVVASSVAIAGDDEGKNSFKATLNGYNEVVGGVGATSTGSVSTGAAGIFRAKLRENGTELDFTLTYSGMEGGPVTAAHPHFAQEHVGGGVFGFFCGGTKPACPTPGGTVTGIWTAADIIGPADQGVAAGSFAEFVRALRAGAVYVNVHSNGATPPAPSYPEGEIRGQIRGGGGDDDD
jgi:hypothetical protein